MRRRKSTIFFLILGISLISLAVALQVGWILLNLQQIVLLVFGIVFFSMIITGLVLNTTFLLREIKRNEQQNAFLNAMTHELKTPIASIRLYLQTLSTRDLPEEKRKEFYEIMLSDSDRLLSTVDQVLGASKAREKSPKLNLAEFDLVELLRECASIISNRYHLKPGTIKLPDPPDAITVSADRRDIETVFVNLLDNAVKYSGPDAEVTVKTRVRQNGTAEIHVRDRGPGIPADELKRIFRRFYRVPNDSTRSAKGTGLGLYIVKSVVEAHGGRIFAKSKGENRGATFIVRLPLAK